MATRRRDERGGDAVAAGAAAMIRLLIADDHNVVRAALGQLVGTFADVELVGSAAGGEEAVALCRERSPDVVLMDLEMPDVDGIEATRRILEEHSDARVVVLTSFAEEQRILRALDAGAVGYVLKDADPEELEKAIEAAGRGEAPLDPKVGRVLIRGHAVAPPEPELSERECEVLALVAAGCQNKEIAERLGITEKTVKGHLTSIFRRVGVTDRTQAALWAERHGLG